MWQIRTCPPCTCTGDTRVPDISRTQPLTAFTMLLSYLLSDILWFLYEKNNTLIFSVLFSSRNITTCCWFENSVSSSHCVVGEEFHLLCSPYIACSQHTALNMYLLNERTLLSLCYLTIPLVIKLSYLLYGSCIPCYSDTNFAITTFCPWRIVCRFIFTVYFVAYSKQQISPDFCMWLGLLCASGHWIPGLTSMRTPSPSCIPSPACYAFEDFLSFISKHFHFYYCFYFCNPPWHFLFFSHILLFTVL